VPSRYLRGAPSLSTGQTLPEAARVPSCALRRAGIIARLGPAAQPLGRSPRQNATRSGRRVFLWKAIAAHCHPRWGCTLRGPNSSTQGTEGPRVDTQGCTSGSAAHAKPEHAGGQGRPWKPTVQHTAPTPWTLSAICPWPPQHADPRRDKVTHGETKKNVPYSREFAAIGPFSQGVAGGGFEPPKAKPAVLQTSCPDSTI
jgi:hypothetical protein